MNTHAMLRPVCYRRTVLPCLGACTLLLGSLLRPVMADDPKPPAPPATAPAPATAPVAPAPKAVVLAFAAALEKGDAATAKSLLVPDESGNRAKWVDATIALSGALRKLDA